MEQLVEWLTSLSGAGAEVLKDFLVAGFAAWLALKLAHRQESFRYREWLMKNRLEVYERRLDAFKALRRKVQGMPALSFHVPLTNEGREALYSNARATALEKQFDGPFWEEFLQSRDDWPFVDRKMGELWVEFQHGLNHLRSIDGHSVANTWFEIFQEELQRALVDSLPDSHLKKRQRWYKFWNHRPNLLLEQDYIRAAEKGVKRAEDLVKSK